MWRKPVWTLLATVVAVLCVALSVRANKEALDFNEALIDNLKKLNSEAYAFGKLLQPLLQEGKEVDPGVLETQLSTLKKTLTAIKKGLGALRAPEGQLAKDYLAAYENLLKGQEKVIEVDYASLVAVVGDETLKLKIKKERIQKTLRGVLEEEEKELQQFRAAQQAFAREYGLKLKE